MFAFDTNDIDFSSSKDRTVTRIRTMSIPRVRITNRTRNRIEIKFRD